jgi:hypothetical protein
MTVDGQVVHTASDGHLPQASHADVSGVQFDVWSNRQGESVSRSLTFWEVQLSRYATALPSADRRTLDAPKGPRLVEQFGAPATRLDQGSPAFLQRPTRPRRKRTPL